MQVGWASCAIACTTKMQVYVIKMLEDVGKHIKFAAEKRNGHNRSKSSNTFLNVSVECDKFIVEEEDVSVV